jgi:hypothetical protein
MTPTNNLLRQVLFQYSSLGKSDRLLAGSSAWIFSNNGSRRSSVLSSLIHLAVIHLVSRNVANEARALAHPTRDGVACGALNVHLVF